MDSIIEIGGVWFAFFGAEETGQVLYSYDRATWELYKPNKFNDIMNNKRRK